MNVNMFGSMLSTNSSIKVFLSNVDLYIDLITENISFTRPSTPKKMKKFLFNIFCMQANTLIEYKINNMQICTLVLYVLSAVYKINH